MDSEFLALYKDDPRFKTDVVKAASTAPPTGTSSGKWPMVELARVAGQPLIADFKKYYEERLPPASSYRVEHKNIPVEGGTIVLRCIIPAGAEDGSYPVLVWYHGGAWIMGDIEMDDNHLRCLAVDLQIVTVNVDYRLAPEYPFPIGINDSFASLKWVAENASSIQVSLAKGFLIGGDSAGSNIAAVLAHLARDDPVFSDCKVTGQCLRQPSVHPDHHPYRHRSEPRSIELFKDGPILTREGLLQCRALLGAPLDDPRASPYHFPSHAGLPRAFITRNGHDGLRDDGRLWEEVLRDAGVETRAVEYEGFPHGFYYAFPQISLAVKMDRDMREALRWLLGRV
ncbi:Alpha/Beta hydrolase protein [Trametes meyenii]|nr:Alpha/Beta hydrolase protein [Trametes meyenii]